jgi:hypothetical protein
MKGRENKKLSCFEYNFESLIMVIGWKWKKINIYSFFPTFVTFSFGVYKKYFFHSFPSLSISSPSNLEPQYSIVNLV